MDDPIFSDLTHPDSTSNDSLFVDAPAPSPMESAARGAANNFPLAPQAISSVEPGSYSQNMTDWNKNAAVAKAENPVSYGAGAVGGSLAPLAIPGVGEALKAAPMLTSGALGAAGALSNTDLSKNPKEALEEGATGAVSGAALGKIGDIVSGALGKGAEGLEGMADKNAVQSMGLRPGSLGLPEDELKEMGSSIHSLGLDKGSLQDRAALAQDLTSQAGAQIGDIGAGAAPLKDASPFISDLSDKLKSGSEFYGDQTNPEIGIYRQGIANLSKPGLTFDTLQDLKQTAGARAFDKDGNVVNKAAADVYNAYKDAMKSVIDSSPADYQDAMDHYAMLKDFEGGLQRQLQNEQAMGSKTKGIGMPGRIAGAIGAHPLVTAGAGAAALPFHPMIGAGMIGSGLMDAGGANAIQRGLSGGLNNTAAMTPKMIQAMNEYFASKEPEFLGHKQPK